MPLVKLYGFVVKLNESTCDRGRACVTILGVCLTACDRGRVCVTILQKL